MPRKRKQPQGGLGEYRRKRRPGKTPEPGGDSGNGGGGSRRRFTIQQHSARRLHWDLRLERDGVLASWALPKGLPPHPDRNHKAVHTEDHPLEYLEFEGEIPAGNYGAGAVEIWDRGTYECEKFRDDEVIVTLHGERADGRYALFRAGKEERDWMIHRMDEPAERAEPLPERLLPMLPRPAKLPPEDGSWGYEIAWSGVRAIAYSTPGELRLLDAALEDVSRSHPEIRRLNRQLGSISAVLDGEIVSLAEGPPTFQIFDLLYVDGRSLLERPYEERRGRLEELELAGAAWQTPGYHRGDGRQLLAAAHDLGLVGIVAKRLDSPYTPGARGGDWLLVTTASGRGSKQRPAAAPARRFDVRAVEAGRSRAGVQVEVEGRSLKLTNLDKVLYPASGFSKRDAIDYYARIAPTVTPHLAGRPLTLKRYPDGVDGPHFFEKSCPSHRPEWIETVSVPSERKGQIRFCLISDLPGMVWLANLADLELHPSLSRAADLEQASALAFDLDPGPGTDLLDCCEVGLLIKGMLEQLGLRCFPKVSGKKGLHLFAPLNSGAGYERTKPFARQVAETLEQRFPKRVTSNMAKSRRQGRLLVDWSQNDRHKTTLAVYSLRATERPAVSVPLEWAELERALKRRELSALRFTPDQALERVERHGDLFAPVLSTVQELPAI